MTSRQPEATPPRAPGRAGTVADSETPGQVPGHDGAPEDGPRAAPARYWPLVLPLTLLIILGLAGLRGTVTQPGWNGPLHRDGLVIGLALEVVLGVLLVITLVRRSAGSHAARANLVAVKLRGVLTFVLSAGMIVVAVITIAGLHLHLFDEKPAKRPAASAPTATPTKTAKSQWPLPFSSLHITLAAFLYTLLIVVLLAGLVLSVWWARRLRPSIAPRAGDFIAEDSDDLREAVESGRSALHTVDDARAAIIACYVAMEDSLAARGAARAAADTPDELLARATKSGVVRGTAAARLTALFYEARFSSHRLGQGQRDAAARALDELAAALADAETAHAEPAGARHGGTGPARAQPPGAGA
jgi:Domain of unknown function (DUF4129)